MGRLAVVLVLVGAAGCASDMPSFVSVLLPGDTFDTVGPYRVEAEVLAPNGVLRVTLRLFPGDDPEVYSDLPFTAIEEDKTGGEFYVELPGRPVGTVFRFYLQVVDGKRGGGGKIAVFPSGAPDDLATFSVLSP